MNAVRVRISDDDLKDINPNSQLYRLAAETLQEKQEGAAYRQYALDRLQKDGELEFDDDAAVSLGADNGAYVMGWVWVSDDVLSEEGYRDQ